MPYKTGKRPARPGAIAMRFGAYFNDAHLPVPPAAFGRPWLISQWYMFANDRCGDCVFAGGAHETMLLAADAGNSAIFTSSGVVSDYSAVTGYVDGDPSTDNGTDVQQAAAYRQKTGLIDASGARHKIDVYTSLHPGNLDQLALATFLFGCVGVGVMLPSNAESQFDAHRAWNVEADSPGVEGHYIPCVGRNSVGNYLFVTWGRLHAATPAWVRTYMDEGICYISRERLRASGLSPQGLNLAALDDDYRQLTSS